MGTNALEAALEELYAAPLAAFTKKRDALAASLDKADAAALRARRKPTVVAHVLNSLARRHADDVADLVDVGRELARAHRKALRGDPGGALRSSIDRQRSAVTSLAKKAHALMRELDVGAGHADEVVAALRAAIVDPTFGAALEEGRLERAPEGAVSFGGPLAVVAEETAAAPAKETKKKAARGTRATDAKDAKAAKAAKDAKAARAAKAKGAEAARAAKAKAAQEARRRKQAVAAARAELRAAEADAKKKLAAADRAARAAATAQAKAEKLAADAQRSGERLAAAKAAVDGAARA